MERLLNVSLFIHFLATNSEFQPALVYATGPIVIQVNTDNYTNDGSETGFRFRYVIKNR